MTQDENGNLKAKFSEEECKNSHVIMSGKFKHLMDMQDVGKDAFAKMKEINETNAKFCALFENSKPN